MFVAPHGPARVLARVLLQAGRYEEPQCRRHQHDHHDPAEVLGERELPADEDPEHEPELPHEVGRGELEGEGRDCRRAFLEQRLGDRDRGVGAGRRRGPQARGPAHRARPPARHQGLDPLSRNPSLHDRRDEEPEHKRPPHLVGHEKCVPEAVADLGDHIVHDSECFRVQPCYGQAGGASKTKRRTSYASIRPDPGRARPDGHSTGQRFRRRLLARRCRRRRLHLVRDPVGARDVERQDDPPGRQERQLRPPGADQERHRIQVARQHRAVQDHRAEGEHDVLLPVAAGQDDEQGRQVQDGAGGHLRRAGEVLLDRGRGRSAREGLAGAVLQPLPGLQAPAERAQRLQRQHGRHHLLRHGGRHDQRPGAVHAGRAHGQDGRGQVGQVPPEPRARQPRQSARVGRDVQPLGRPRVHQRLHQGRKRKRDLQRAG